MELKWPTTQGALAKRQYSVLHDSTVKREYRYAREDCAMDGEKVTLPRAVQNLVQVWKVLWRWRSR